MNDLINKKIWILKTVLIIFIIFSWFNLRSYIEASEISIGVSPSSFSNDSLMPGSYYEQEIIISRANPDTDAKAVIEIEECSVENWISFDPGSEIELPKNEQRVTAKIKVDVPEYADLGSYNGYLRIKLVREESDGQVTLVPAVRMDIDMKVTNVEVVDLEVKMVNIEDFAEGQTMIVMLRILNKGNVSSSLSKVKVDILDLDENKIVSIEKDEIDPVAPFTLDDIDVEYDNVDLDIGEYFADVFAYNDSCIYEDRVAFKVIKGDGSIAEDSDREIYSGDGTEITDRGSNKLLSKILISSGVIIVCILLVGVIVFIIKEIKERDEVNKKYKKREK